MDYGREALYRAVAFGGVEDVISTAQAALKRPVSLYSALLRQVAGSFEPKKPEQRIALWSFPLGGGDSCRVFSLSDCTEYELVQDGEPVAHIFVGGHDQDGEMTELMCRGISTTLRRREASSPGHKFSTELFIRQLFSGEEFDRAMERSAELLGIDADGEFIVIAVSLADLQPDRKKVAAQVDAVESLLDAPGAVLGGSYGALVAWEQYEKKRGRLIKLLENNGLLAAESRKFSGLREASKHFHLAGRSLSLRDCVGQTVGLMEYQAAEPYLMADGLYGGEAYLHPIIEKLTELDKTGKFSMTETLEAYLGSGLSVPTASARLHIHRNTMDYRLARLQEQTDIDWNDGELLFRLYLSLHNLKYNKCNKVTEAESDE
jgi:hypothetical protein